MKAIRVAGIGVGGVFHAHLRGYKTVSDLFSLVAVCDINKGAAQRIGEENKIQRVYTSFEALLKDGDIDAVDICLPHDLHAPVAIAAAASGCHVLVEKPMALSLEEIDGMIETAQANHVKLMCAFCERYDPQYIKIKELVDGGWVGDVLSARADHNQNVVVPQGHWIRQKARLGGGLVFSAGCHRLDLLRWIVGEVEAVSCFGAHWDERMEGEVAGTVNLQFKNGAIGTMVMTWVARRTPWYEGFWIYGKRGSLHNMNRVHLDSELASQDAGYVKQEIEPKDNFVEEIRHFGECILEDREPLTSGADARKTMEICIAANRAMETQSVVKLPL
ncbi:Gfo/Idh/MocA family oxidoreductase [Candidatus Poribacteria bacterium]|nr:Gfo/Idh/MocA family oxidoreductase [Candidatus Poribacteria bacterium]